MINKDTKKSILIATILLTITFGLLLIKPETSNAQMFPIDAHTEFFEFNSNGTYQIKATSTFSLLGIAPMLDTAGTMIVKLYCGYPLNEANEIYENFDFTTSIYFLPVQHVCTNESLTLYTESVAGRGGAIGYTIVNRDISIATSTDSITVNTTTTPMQNYFYAFMIFFLVSFSIFYLIRKMI